MRVATWNAELTRDGPGLLLRDIVRGGDAQVDAAAQTIAAVAPDILLLQNVDYDMELRALIALRDLIAAQGLRYEHLYAGLPNTGMATDLDMDGDGRLGEPEDAQGYGAFLGQGGMAVLSRYPIAVDAVQDLSGILWRDVPGALLPGVNGAPFPSAQAQGALRLADVAQWAVPVLHDSGPVTLLAFHANAPVFDGPEDRNGRRNHDQLRFWQHYLDGVFGPAPDDRFVLLGHANQDPHRSEGIKAGIRGLLADPRVTDPVPLRARAPPGDPPEATVNWPRVTPSQMRVSYVLPSRDWTVSASGVHWPVEGEGARVSELASRHRMVWVDLQTR
ncbi:endonuclease/exonuclease/phosphatase family protein [Roseovarius dicentrarchi]|uniref:endonuclease/exonuclease/phosphatase family protein n=1 Tax=Roseovarius dicentrarchi TaxID=2250573 RepID=UPI00193A1E3D|nr:endonuclease/exonuclease/phosphatase family protein [Roseovarius dicentrarchi]